MFISQGAVTKFTLSFSQQFSDELHMITLSISQGSATKIGHRFSDELHTRSSHFRSLASS
jgi:hypothetical protein